MSGLLEALKLKQKGLSARKSRDNTVKLPNGSSRWRLLPHWSGDENAGLPFHDYGKHFIKDFSGEVQSVYICTAKTFGKHCPVCDAITKSELSIHDENAKNLVSNAKAAQRYLVNAVRRNDKGYEAEVVILELSGSAFEEVVNLAVQYASDGINIFSLEEGYDLIFNREGTGLKTKYKAMLAPRSSPIDVGYMTKVTNLSDYVQQEYEEGKTKALMAISNISGSSTPALPSAVRASTPEVIPSARVTAAATTAASVGVTIDEDTSLDVDLSEVDLTDLESIED